MKHQLVVVLDFGSQYTQLIARRIREQSVYCEIHPFTIATDPELRQLRAMQPLAIVLSGGPSSVYEPGAPMVPAAVFELGIPVLAISCVYCEPKSRTTTSWCFIYSTR